METSHISLPQPSLPIAGIKAKPILPSPEDNRLGQGFAKSLLVKKEQTPKQLPSPHPQHASPDSQNFTHKNLPPALATPQLQGNFQQKHNNIQKQIQTPFNRNLSQKFMLRLDKTLQNVDQLSELKKTLTTLSKEPNATAEQKQGIESALKQMNTTIDPLKNELGPLIAQGHEIIEMEHTKDSSKIHLKTEEEPKIEGKSKLKKEEEPKIHPSAFHPGEVILNNIGSVKKTSEVAQPQTKSRIEMIQAATSQILVSNVQNAMSAGEVRIPFKSDILPNTEVIISRDQKGGLHITFTTASEEGGSFLSEANIQQLQQELNNNPAMAAKNITIDVHYEQKQADNTTITHSITVDSSNLPQNQQDDSRDRNRRSATFDQTDEALKEGISQN